MNTILTAAGALLSLLLMVVCWLLMLVLFASGIFMGWKMLEGLDAVGLAEPLVYGVGAGVCFYWLSKVQKFAGELGERNNVNSGNISSEE